jgi:MFS family permease
VYLSRLDASAAQLGLLSAGPALVNLLISMPAGRWIETQPLIRVSFLTAALHRSGYLVLIPLPWLLPPAWQVWAILLVSLLMSVAGTFLAIGFNAMFADVVPPEWRGEVVGRRNALVAVSITLTSILCGWLLDRIVFPLNYQVVFGIGAFGAILSTYHLGKLRALGQPVLRMGRPMLDFARPGLPRFIDALRPMAGLRFLARARGEGLLRLDRLRGSFGLLIAAFFTLYVVQYIPIPLFPLFIVRELRLADSDISIGNVLFYTTMLVLSLSLRRASARFGHRGVLLFSALFFSLYPLLLGLARGPGLYWLASVIGGGVWALMSAGLVNRLMERVPEGDRPAHMALHNLALNLGILAGSLTGPLLGNELGLRPALFLAAGLRLLGALVIWRWG